MCGIWHEKSGPLLSNRVEGNQFPVLTSTYHTTITLPFYSYKHEKVELVLNLEQVRDSTAKILYIHFPALYSPFQCPSLRFFNTYRNANDASIS